MKTLTSLESRRLAIEQGLVKPRGKVRRALAHPENVRATRSLLRAALQATGLLQRGERNASRPLVRQIRFELPRLPEAFCGFRILHLSDLHVDARIPLAERVALRLEGLEADLCVLTGDYRFEVSGPCEDVYRAMARIVRAVRAACGIVGILGNHDPAESVAALGRMGVTVLVNEALEIAHEGESMWVLGVDDPHYYGCDDLPAALADVPGDAFTVLLAHSPELVEAAAAAGVDLYLCGHTHGGQICLPWVGPLWLNARCPRRFTRGAWSRDGTHGFTSAGVGCSLLPVRFNCPPEIAVIELRCSRHAAVEAGARSQIGGATRLPPLGARSSAPPRGQRLLQLDMPKAE